MSLPLSPAPSPEGADVRRGRSARRVALVVVLALVAAVALVGAGLALAARSLEGNVQRDRVFSELEEAERPEEAQRPGEAREPGEDAPTRALDVLVLGSDSRDNEVGRKWRGDPADDIHAGERSDTTLLVHLTADRDAAWVVSLPRDSWVEMPACRGRDGEPIPEREAQFNYAFRDGGVSCAVKTVESLTGVRIDHTVVIDFLAFRDMVDALGGVAVCLDEPLQPDRVDLDLPAGRHVLDGDDALGFVRARYGVDDGGDLQRIERQKQFMSAMLDRALSRGMLARPDRLLRFLSATASGLRVDEDLDLRRLALQLRGVEPGSVAFSTVPLDPDPGPAFEPGGRLAGRVAWDEPAAAELFEAVRAGRLPTDEAERSADDVPDDDGVTTPAPETPASPAGSPEATTAAEQTC